MATVDENRNKLIVTAAIIIVILFVIVLNFPIVVIGAGERGVVFNNISGIEDRVLDEGVHFRIPFVQIVKTLSVKVQKNEIDAQAASKDLQTVTTKIVINWHLDDKETHRIYQNIGDEKTVVDRIIVPNTNEVVKAATAQKTAEELLTKRADLKNVIDTSLTERLKTYNIILDDVSIVDLDFSEQFNQAIEAKATAEQNALKAQNDLKRIEIEAQQQIETAKAEAESIRIKTQALQQNQELVKLNAVEKWDGKLPTYVLGSSIPFIQIPQP